MAVKYLGNATLIGQRAADIIGVWTRLSQVYHAGLRNLADPWDRAFSYDLTKWMQNFGTYIWDIVGQEYSPLYRTMPANAQPRVTDMSDSIIITIYSSLHN